MRVPEMNGGGMRVPAPKLSPLWQDRQSAGSDAPADGRRQTWGLPGNSG